MLKNTTVKLRLIFVLALLRLISVALSSLGLRALGATNDSLRTVYEDRLVAIGQLHEILALTQQNHLTVAEGVYKDVAALPADADIITQQMAKVSATWKAYAATYLTPQEKVLAERFDAVRTRFVQDGLNPALVAMRAGDTDKLRAVVEGPLRQLATPVRSTIGDLVHLQLAVGKTEYLASQARYDQSKMMSVSLTVLGIVIGLLVGYWIISNILASLAKALRIAESVAQGDLTRELAPDADNEVGRLVNALRAMQQNLVRIVGGVRSGTDAIATAASQIAAGTYETPAKLDAAVERLLNEIG